MFQSKLGGWALLDIGPGEERVKWSFTMTDRYQTRIPIIGCGPIINWVLFDDVSMGIFHISSPRFYLRYPTA